MKEYHFGRFIDHFRTYKGKSLLRDKFTILKIFFLIFLFFFALNLKLFYILLFLIYLAELGRKFSKPVFTPKAIALILLSLTVSAAGFLLADILVPIAVSIFVFILKPITYFFAKNILAKASKKRSQFKDLIVIGITGSYGKTSTKEFLYAILSEKFKVLKTPKHINAEVGVAKTILKDLKPEHQIFIAEIGAYNVGKIKEVCNATKPKIGILTGINEQHMATFGSQEKIYKAKHEIFECLPPDGIKIEKNNLKLKVSGLIENKENIFFKINEIEFNVNLLGKHNLDNVLLAIDCAQKLGMSLEEISKACLKIKSNKIIKRNPVIIDNSYSANPTGVVSDIEYLKLYSGRSAVVMPCLIELGKASKDVHQRIGKKLNEVADLAIITSKDWFEAIKKEFPKAIYSENPNEIFEKLKGFETILIEGRIPKNILEKIKCL